MALHVVRRGYRLVYTSKARSLERVSASAQDEIARRARIVAGRYQAIALAPQLLPLRKPPGHLASRFAQISAPFGTPGYDRRSGRQSAGRHYPVSSAEFPVLHLASPFSWLFLASQLLFYGLAWVGWQLKPKADWGLCCTYQRFW